MKKTFVVFVVCSVLGANLCLGTELGDSKNFQSQMSLSQVDKEMLFGVDANQADVVLLSDEEMKATEGDGFLSTFLITGTISLIGYGVCKATGGDGCSFMAKGKHNF